MRSRGLPLLMLAVVVSELVGAAPAWSQGAGVDAGLEAASAGWPTAEQWVRVLTLRDYNTRLVVGGTAMLGLAAGVVGGFTLLRKRALMGDALSHATFPGIGLAFLIASAAGAAGKSLPVLLVGAAVSGVTGVGVMLLLRRYTRLKEDTVLGVVLGVFFGAGLAVLGVVQQMGTGSAAGLQSFIYGKTASMVPADVVLIGVSGLAVLAVSALLYKEFKLLCFDQAFAAVQGWPVLALDVVLMGLVVVVTVIGLQAVGLILVIALLITPAAAARFWSDRMKWMIVLAGVLGAASAAIGAGLSAVFSRLPSGAIIVIAAAAAFLISMLFGPARGVVPRWLRRRRLERTIGEQHLLRAMYEMSSPDDPAVAVAELRRRRSWSSRRLRRHVRHAEADGLILAGGPTLRLTDAGLRHAARVTRNHRLWETYLIAHADIAPSHVDRDADLIEHVLGPEMIDELEALVADDDQRLGRPPILASPHPVAPHA